MFFKITGHYETHDEHTIAIVESIDMMQIVRELFPEIIRVINNCQIKSHDYGDAGIYTYYCRLEESGYHYEPKIKSDLNENTYLSIYEDRISIMTPSTKNFPEENKAFHENRLSHFGSKRHKTYFDYVEIKKVEYIKVGS